MNSPEYSVIIATHLRPVLLRRALESVLAQKWPCHQIIVVSDVEDPETYRVASSLLRPRDCFVQCPGIRGPATSRNLALKLVTGSDVVFLDDDDAFRESFLADVSLQRRSQAAPEILFTDFEVIHEHEGGKVTPVALGAFPLEQIWIKNFIPNNCLIYPYAQIAGITFDEAFAYEDWDFVLSAHSQIPLRHVAVNGPVIYKNANAEEKNRGEKNNENLLECYIRVYKKHTATAEIREKRLAFFKGVDIDLGAFLKD